MASITASLQTKIKTPIQAIQPNKPNTTIKSATIKHKPKQIIKLKHQNSKETTNPSNNKSKHKPTKEYLQLKPQLTNHSKAIIESSKTANHKP